MKWSHDYKRDVLHPNKTQTRTCTCLHEYTLENIKEAVKNEQSRETDNIVYTKRRQTKQKHNTICFRHLYAQT